MISHSNLTIYKPWNEEKILRVCKWIFQVVIAKIVSIIFIFNQHNLFNSLLCSPLFSRFECSIKNRHSNVCLKFFFDAKLIMSLFIFLNVSSKKLKWKQHFYIDTWSTFEYGCLAGLHIKEEKRQRPQVDWCATFVW